MRKISPPLRPALRLLRTRRAHAHRHHVDTDTQYAFTRPIVAQIMKKYDGVLKIGGEIGDKKVSDPRSYPEAAEQGMSGRVSGACHDPRSEGPTLFGQV